MSEFLSNSQKGEPIKRSPGLPENQQCLKYPGFKCNCRLSKIKIRRRELRKLREELGAYSFLNLLDPGLAECHEERRKQLCEGQQPTLVDRIRSIRIRIF